MKSPFEETQTSETTFVEKKGFSFMGQLEKLKPEEEEQLNARLSDEQMNAVQLLGAVKASILISRAISAESLKTLQAIRDEKLYLHYGSRTFDEFLDHHPDSTMSYYQFHQREELLEKEGALTFQLLNTLRIPASKRKLLTAGEINVNGKEVEINGETFSVASDIELRKLIVAIIDEKAEADRRREASEKTIERGKKEIEKHKRTIVDLEEKISRGGGAVSADHSPHARALVSLLGDFQMLTQEVQAIDDETEKKRFSALALEHLAEAKSQFETSLGFEAPDNKLGLNKEDETELLDSID